MDDLPDAAQRADLHGGISGVVVAGFPQLLAGHLVVADQRRAISAAHGDENAIAVDDRGAVVAMAARGGLFRGWVAALVAEEGGAVILAEAHAPDLFAIGHGQAGEFTTARLQIGAVAVDDRCAARAAAVRGRKFHDGADGGCPELFAGRGVEAMRRFVGSFGIEQENLAAGGDGRRLAGAGVNFPKHLRVVGQLVQLVIRILDDGVPVRSAPLRPICGMSRGKDENRSANEAEGSIHGGRFPLLTPQTGGPQDFLQGSKSGYGESIQYSVISDQYFLRNVSRFESTDH
ncbi:hypothetical protein CfE428DRAFT_3177 [Chthoniobacter flavus Ellin428]|uniref:Uncharacterized protein n=1 Tax=Chthoniobacter flavus Ellin428 TaxID=497964 RepID=B4D2Q2_9BACT|nr:hypothetical protein [Chthoniobacter flavus]EDY19492.1 hypothetical protein CfE428DRAFT_3177 [Chthoniobacter flavus Ellin428]